MLLRRFNDHVHEIFALDTFFVCDTKHFKHWIHYNSCRYDLLWNSWNTLRLKIMMSPRFQHIHKSLKCIFPLEL